MRSKFSDNYMPLPALPGGKEPDKTTRIIRAHHAQQHKRDQTQRPSLPKLRCLEEENGEAD